jgi:hypothetical protein
VERISALCRDVERAIKAATESRAGAADALALLRDAQAKSTRLCEEVDSLLPPVKPPAARTKRTRRR